MSIEYNPDNYLFQMVKTLFLSASKLFSVLDSVLFMFILDVSKDPTQNRDRSLAL